MNKIIIFTLLCFYSHTIMADMCRMTVIAESGLSLREEANLQSKKLTVVDFGEIVRAEGPCYLIHEAFKDDIIEIDGKRGFWIKVIYKEKWGYMFSGYLMLEDAFPYAQNDTIDCIMIDEIFGYDDLGAYKIDSFNYRFYTPHLNWYGVTIQESSTVISKADLQLNFNNNRWDSGERNMFLNAHLEVKDGADFDFLFGTKKRLSEGNITSQFHKNCDEEIGMFLYPEEIYSESNEVEYWFQAKEKTFVQGANVQKNYTLNLSFPYNTVTYRMNDALSLYGDAQLHARHQNPMLVWSGDLNQDTYPDFIFKINPMEGKCGLFPYLKLVYSNVDEGNKLKYKSNLDIIEMNNFIKE